MMTSVNKKADYTIVHDWNFPQREELAQKENDTVMAGWKEREGEGPGEVDARIVEQEDEEASCYDHAMSVGPLGRELFPLHCDAFAQICSAS